MNTSCVIFYEKLDLLCVLVLSEMDMTVTHFLGFELQHKQLLQDYNIVGSQLQFKVVYIHI